MKTGFKDPVDSKPTKKFKNPWDFTQPDYDERSSSFINAGSNHGVGTKSPVGRIGDPKMEVSTLPKGRVSTMKVDKIPNKELDSQ